MLARHPSCKPPDTLQTKGTFGLDPQTLADQFLAEESIAPVSPIHGQKSELHVTRTTWVRQYFGVQRPPTKSRPTVAGEPIFW
jgi:hypothetical protein